MVAMMSFLKNVRRSVACKPAPRGRRGLRNAAMRSAILETMEPRVFMTVAPATGLTLSFGTIGITELQTTLSWTNHQANASAIEIEVKEGVGNWFTAYRLSGTANTYSDAYFQADAPYDVRIRTITPDGSAYLSGSFTTPNWSSSGFSGVTSYAVTGSGFDGGTAIQWTRPMNALLLAYTRNPDQAFPNRWKELIPSVNFSYPGQINGIVWGNDLGFATDLGDNTFAISDVDGWEGKTAWTSSSAVVISALGSGTGGRTTLASTSYTLSTPQLTGTRNSDNTVSLAWTAATGASSITYAIMADGTNIVTPYTSVTDDVVATITPTMEYNVYAAGGLGSVPGWQRDGYFFVQAYDGGYGEGLSSHNSNIVDLSVALTPTNLAATPIRDGKTMHVSWSNTAYNETGYELWRAVGTGPSVLVKTLAADTTDFDDTGRNADGSSIGELKPGQTYTYKVRAKRAGANLSSPYTEVPVTIPDKSCWICNLLGLATPALGQAGSPQAASNGGTTDAGGTQVAISSFTSSAGMTFGEATFVSALGTVSSGALPTFEQYFNTSTVSTIMIGMGDYKLFFHSTGGGYYAGTGNPFSLAKDDDTFTLTDGVGGKVIFTCGDTDDVGQFSEMDDAFGNRVYATGYAANGKPSAIRQDLLGSHYETYNYTYGTSGVTNGRLTQATLNRDGSGTPTETLTYTYYDGSEAYGQGGDLKKVVHTTVAGASSTAYLRYVTADDGTSRLKYVVFGSSFDRLTAEHPGVGVESLTNVSTYADLNYEQDAGGRVTSIIAQGNGCSLCSGGFGTTTFDYTTSAFSSYTVNTWKTKRVETLPGYDASHTANSMNAQVITYSNDFGQPILVVTVQTATGTRWMDFYQYDDAGRLLLHAYPSAVTNLNEAYGDLVNYAYHDTNYISDTTGLIEYTEYDGAYAYRTYITNGDGGEDEPTRHYQSLTNYTTHTADNGVTITLIEDAVTFVGDVTDSPSTSSPGARVVHYTYTYQMNGTSSTNAIATIAKTLPAIGTLNNGAGVPSIITQAFDRYGRTTWTIDAGGFINYAVYDPKTGALVKTIQDVQYSLLSGGEQTSLNAVSTNHHAAGLNLISNYTNDSMGRTTVMSDPKGNKSYNIYDDAHHATFSLRGATLVTSGTNGTMTATGPIAMRRDQIPFSASVNGASISGTYSESLTFSGALSVVIVGGEVQLLSNTWANRGTTSDAALLNLIGNASSGTQYTIQSLSRSLRNGAGQTIASDAYNVISSAGYLASPANSPFAGATSNHYETTYGYNVWGALAETINPNGTLTVQTYDVLGRPRGTYVGTDDTPTDDQNGFGDLLHGNWEDFVYAVNANPAATLAGENMVLVSLNTYDGGGVGDSNLTQTTYFIDVGTTSASQRVTQYLYDWRDRRVTVKQGVLSVLGNETTGTLTHRPLTIQVMDNLGEVTDAFRFDGDGIQLTDANYDGVPDALDNDDDGVPTDPDRDGNNATDATSPLRAYAKMLYDEQGRAFRTKTYIVDPATGDYHAADTTGTYTVVSDTWFDLRGNAIASHTSGGPMSKMEYDGVGRVTNAYVTDGGAVNNMAGGHGILTGWSDAATPANDIVLEQTAYAYDANGNTIETVVAQRFDTDPATASGALFTSTIETHATSSSYQSLIVTAHTGSSWAARFYYASSYYDDADRLTAAVNVGTNGGSAYLRPAAAATVSSDTLLLTKYGYDASGRVGTVTDPRDLESKTYYDALGRTTRTVAHFVDDTPGGLDPSEDQTTRYTYDGAGHVLTVTADLPSGQNDQVTQYIYGVTSYAIYSNDLLRDVYYPHPSTGAASSSYTDHFAYDRLGEVVYKTDRNGTAFEYTYDVLGRLVETNVTPADGNPQGVGVGNVWDPLDAVFRVTSSYNSQGLLDTVTTYNAAYGGDVVNEVKREYNGLGQLTKEFQAHHGFANTGTVSTSPVVIYGYGDPAKGSRLESMTYPSGKVLSYNYGTANGLNDVIGRLENLSEPSQTLESYKYLGLGTVVTRAHAQPGVDLTYIGASSGDAGDKYVGLDRFGRVADQRWATTGGTDLDRYQYAYDRDSNVTAKTNALYNTYDDTYVYDGLNRLEQAYRTNGTGDYDHGYGSQMWGLDALGNMASVVVDGVTQTRTHDSQNQLTGMGAATLYYDNNGNTTTDDQGHQLYYDAWNRLVQVTSGTLTLRSYSYDGMGRRTLEGTPGTNTTELFYSSNWQVIEEDTGVIGTTLKVQNVYSPVYVDALVLRDYDFSGGGSFQINERAYVMQDANFNVTGLVTQRTMNGSTPYGDTNADGHVDVTDLGTYATYSGQSVTGGNVHGDFNNDGVVNSADGAILSGSYGLTGTITWQVTQRMVYAPYGKVTFLDSAWADGSNIMAMENTAQGGREDFALGFIDKRNRVYSISMARPLQADPLGYVDGMSSYLWEGGNPICHVDPDGTTVKEDQVIGPSEAVDRADKAEKAARISFYVSKAIVSTFNRSEFSSINSISLNFLRAEFFPGMASDGVNAFVYTCKYGFIDLGHFFIAAYSAYYTFEGNSAKAIGSTYKTELEQDWWRTHVARDGWGDSAFTAEDLNSNEQGALFGQRMYDADNAIFNRFSYHAYNSFIYGDVISYKNGPSMVANQFKEFLRDAGAVDDKWVPFLRLGVGAQLNDSNGQFKGPRLKTAADQRAWQQSLPTHCRLCDVNNPDRPNPRYAWRI